MAVQTALNAEPQRHHGKPADVSKLSAKIRLLNGGEKREVILAPVGDRLEIKGSSRVAAGTKALTGAIGAV